MKTKWKLLHKTHKQSECYATSNQRGVSLPKNCPFAPVRCYSLPTAGRRKTWPPALALETGAQRMPAIYFCREGCNGNCKNLNCSRHSHGRDDQQQDNNNSNRSCSLQEASPGGAGAGVTPGADNQDSIESRTKGVSQAPQTHSGPTGPPSNTSSETIAQPAPKLQPALETVRESVMEESPSKDPGDKGPPPPASTSTLTSQTTTSSSATAEPSAKAAESQAGSAGSSGSCSNPAAVHRQRRLRTPTWARSMSTNKTYLKFDFYARLTFIRYASSVRSICLYRFTFALTNQQPHSSRMNYFLYIHT